MAVGRTQTAEGMVVESRISSVVTWTSVPTLAPNCTARSSLLKLPELQFPELQFPDL